MQIQFLNTMHNQPLHLKGVCRLNQIIHQIHFHLFQGHMTPMPNRRLFYELNHVLETQKAESRAF